MVINKLPEEVQSIFSSSRQINSYKKAVNELVYNALDAKSTSIAIRVNIEESILLVIDNGCGICELDFKVLGDPYATSKCVNLATLKSVPNQYGFRGIFLSNLIKIAKTVTITSRFAKSKETWIKTFHNGKQKCMKTTTSRPSIGTTVEVKGFLYNLHIQKNAINPLSELQEITKSLQQLSLVLNNISLSLRDDSRNEIMLKLHKTKNIYQTLSSLFGIEKTHVQELKVEKNEYKVIAYIGKNSIKASYHWIFLNKQFIQNNRLYKIVNDNIKKVLCSKTLPNQKLKNTKFYKNNNETDSFESAVPFYFIFISCPYIEYDISSSPKQSMLEFRNWVHINKLLEKLVKFHTGDSKLNELKTPCHKYLCEMNDTRAEVKRIMNRILGSKEHGVSLMQNGVKGRQIKRKTKKKLTNNNISISKVIPLKKDNIPQKYNNQTPYATCQNHNQHNNKTLNKVKSKLEVTFKNNHKTEILNNSSETFDFTHNKNPLNKIFKTKKCSKLNKSKLEQSKYKKYSNYDFSNKSDNPTETLKRKYKNMARKVESISEFNCGKRRKCDIFESKGDNDYRIVKNNIVSVPENPKNLNHQHILLASKRNKCELLKADTVNKKTFMSNYDLLNTILCSQIDSKITSLKNTNKCHTVLNPPNKKIRLCQKDVDTMNYQTGLKLTFESHHYSINKMSFDRSSKPVVNEKKYVKFITEQSKSNFITPENNLTVKNTPNREFRYSACSYDEISKHKPTLHNVKIAHANDTDYKYENSCFTIEFTDSRTHTYLDKSNTKTNTTRQEDFPIHQDGDISIFDYNNYSSNYGFELCCKKIVRNIGNTYCISPNNTSIHSQSQSKETYTSIKNEAYSLHYVNEKENYKRSYTISNIVNTNINNVENDKDTIVSNNIEPIEICETVLSSSSNIREHSFDNNNDCNGYIDQCNEQINSDQYPEVSHHFIKQSNVSNCTLENDVYDGTDKVNAKIISVVNNNPEQYLKQTSNNVFKDSVDILPSTSLNSSKKSVTKNNLDRDDDIDRDNKNNKRDKFKNFDIKNRPYFVPKGMSPIFENNATKYVCNYILDDDYYQNAIYDNFVNDLHDNTDVLRPNITNVKDFTTKDVLKVNYKLKKDNATLIFNVNTLKNAKVLGQIDQKFVAALLKHDKGSEFLVLFDQHAVHERIRLENNLLDYFRDDCWIPISVDGITLKMSKHDVLHLHNYREKFIQLGLQWTILNINEISVHSIPEAILGKNNREAEKIIKAVKSLIAEEISAIKLQSGCLSLYPKSIMDLVFGEACRYAIKFGDKLSKSECIELVNMLSMCKTPFQCAHGRPVMAVLMEIIKDQREYKVDHMRLKNFLSR